VCPWLNLHGPTEGIRRLAVLNRGHRTVEFLQGGPAALPRTDPDRPVTPDDLVYRGDDHGGTTGGDLGKAGNLGKLDRTHLDRNAQVLIVEALRGLERLQGEQVIFLALPLRVRGRDGSPCRAMALDGDISPLVKSLDALEFDIKY